MLKHEYVKPSFKGFMVSSVQVNWNVVKIIYDFGDAIVRMVDKKRLFHYTQLLDKHTKQLMRPKLQDKHKAFYFKYKNYKFLKEANTRYAIICWCFSSIVLSKYVIHKLGI